jgi:hypothetical protein
MSPSSKWVCLALPLLACSVNLHPPPDALITCDNDSDCPDNGVCRGESGAKQCYARGGDSEPPALANVALTPCAAQTSPCLASRAQIQISFDASEPLSSAKLELGTVPRREFTQLTQSGSHYTFGYTPDGTEGERAFPILATLVDTSGNIARDLSTETVQFDFTAPAIVSGSPTVQVFRPDGALAAVPSAASGAKIQVSFTVTEPLAQAPILVSAPDDLGFHLTQQVGLYYQFEATLDGNAGHPQGAYSLSARLTDPAGNVADPVSVGTGFGVDTIPPAAPAVGVAGTPGKILHRRLPWGARATSGQPLFEVVGQAGAAEAGATVVVTDSASGELLGNATAAADGSFRARLVQSDRRAVAITAYDPAGNSSGAPSQVIDIEWVASPNGKVPHSLFENPTTVTITPSLGAGQVQDPLLEQEPDASAISEIYGSGGGTLSVFGTAEWTPVSYAPLPSLRQSPSTTFDSTRRRVLLFGGWNYPTAFNDLWAWDPVSGAFSQVITNGQSPTGRQFPGLAYDGRADALLLYGGNQMGAVGDLSDFWRLDLATGSWTEITPQGSWPGNLNLSHGFAAIDAPRRKLVLVGGRSSTSDSVEVWEWDLDQQTWNQAASLPVTSAYGVVGGFDPVRSAVVVVDQDGTTYEWTPQTGAFVARGNGGPTDGPPQLGYEADLQALVAVWTVGVTNERYSWDPINGTWSGPVALSSTDQAPIERNGLVSDSTTGRSYQVSTNLQVVVHELTPTALLDRTVPATATPPQEQNEQAALDPDTGHVIVFWGPNDGQAVWDFDPVSKKWIDITPSSWPSGLVVVDGAVTDAARSRILLAGYDGFGLRMFQWTRSGGFVDLTPASPAPGTWPVGVPGASGQGTGRGPTSALWFDPTTGTLVEDDGTQDWEVDAATLISPNAPAVWTSYFRPVGEDPKLAGIDPTRGVEIEVFPSFQNVDLADTYERALGQPNWILRGTSARPIPVGRTSTAFVASRGRMIAYGGFGSAGGSFSAHGPYEFDAIGIWGDRNGQGASPSSRGYAALVDLPALQTTVLFGGVPPLISGTTAFNDVWLWDGGNASVPAVVWHVPFHAAGGYTRLVAVDFVSAGGGNGQGVDGAELRVWNADHGGWERPVSSTAPPGTPADLRFTPNGDLGRYFVGRQADFTVAVTSANPNGTSLTPASVAVDDLELHVTYQR